MSSLYDQVTSGRMIKTASHETVDPEKLASIADELKAIAEEGVDVAEKVAEEEPVEEEKVAADEEDQDEAATQDEAEEEEAAEEAAQEEAAEEAEEAPAEEEEAVPAEVAEEEIAAEEEVPAEAIIEEAVEEAAQEAPAEEAPAEEAPAEEAPAEEAPAEEAPAEEAMPEEGTPEYEQLMAMLAAQAAEEKTASTNIVLDMFEKIAEEEKAAAAQAEIAEQAEKIAFEVVSEILTKLDVPLAKYAGLFVEDEKVASAVAEQAEKLASDNGISGIAAVEDIVNALNAEG